MEFRLAGAVSPDRVDVNPRANHVVRQDRGELLVCGRSGDDLSALDCVFSGGAGHELETATFEIAQRLVCCAPVNVVEVDRVDSDDRLHRERLKLSLRAVADQGHRPCPLWGKMPGGHCRGRGGAEGG